VVSADVAEGYGADVGAIILGDLRETTEPTWRFMANLAQFYVPNDAVLRELGRMQVLHGHLDHMLRLVIKRTLGISITNPGYWDETRGMAKQLREKARKLIEQKYKNDDNMAGILNKVLDDAEDVTTLRNRALHSVWLKAPAKKLLLHDRDNTTRQHREFKQPTVKELMSVSKRIVRIQGVLDHLTRNPTSIAFET